VINEQAIQALESEVDTQLEDIEHAESFPAGLLGFTGCTLPNAKITVVIGNTGIPQTSIKF